MWSTLMQLDDVWSVEGDIDDKSWLSLVYKGDIIDYIFEEFTDEDVSTAFAEQLDYFVDAEIVKHEGLHGVLVEFPTGDDATQFKAAYVEPGNDTVYIAGNDDRDVLLESMKTYDPNTEDSE